MIIAIDGVAASGKSTAALLLAKRLGFFYINSGLLYRAIAYLVSKKYGQYYHDYLSKITTQLLDKMWLEHDIEYLFDGNQVKIYIDGKESLDRLKVPCIDRIVSSVAACSVVRDYVTELQRSLAKKNPNTVIEGRDIASHVFPDADFKFFITADLSVRAQRWSAMQEKLGSQVALAEAEKIINERDIQDKTRAVGALVQTKGSVVIDTSLFTTPDQTVKKLVEIINKKK